VSTGVAVLNSVVNDLIPLRTATLLPGPEAQHLAIYTGWLIRLGRRSLTQPILMLLAVAAFGALTIFAVPFPAVVLGSGLLGWVFGRVQPSWMAHPAPTPDGDAAPRLDHR
jgi:chromate transporter